MKNIITVFLLIFITLTKANAAIEPVSFKAKFVMKDKTTFIAYFYSWDTDFDNENTYEKACTDKGFQQYLNSKNYIVMHASFDGYETKTKKYQGITLYKNTYKLKVSNPEITNNVPFCTKNDEIKIDANDILYTVYLGKAPTRQPTIFDDASVQDMRANKIVAIHHETFEVCDYYFYTTDKKMTSKKIATLLKQKKIKTEKLIEMGNYYQKIKTELEKLKIYLFQECMC